MFGGLKSARAMDSARVLNTRQRGRIRPEDCSKTHTPSRRWRKSTSESGSLSVDSAVEALYAGFMNLQVPPELEAKLTRLAAETGRTADQVALDLLASSMDHDEWFRSEVEKGRAAARDGRLLEHDDVAARMDRRYRD
jgi:predicted transcriptional regulator